MKDLGLSAPIYSTEPVYRLGLPTMNDQYLSRKQVSKFDLFTLDDGETALIHAARQGHTATAKYLIDHGADPIVASNLGATALHYVAGIGDIELLKYLLSRGVQQDLESDFGTPLIWAAGHAQPDVVTVLLERGANPNAETDDGFTPLLSAVAADSLACLEL